jgi:hypothetical protein
VRSYPNTARFAILALIVSLMLAPMLVSPALAQAQRPGHQGSPTGCEFDKLGHLVGAAQLSLMLPYTDEPGWTSKVTATVPTSWPPAVDLLMTPNSPSFQAAYGCLFPRDSPAPTSVTLHNDTITIVTIRQGQITGWGFLLPLPWYCQYLYSKAEAVTFSPVAQFSRFGWTKVTVSTHGFIPSNPTPLPASDADTGLQWLNRPPDASGQISFTLTPETLLRVELTAQSGPGIGQYAPYDAEDAVFTVALASLLIRRRRDGGPGARSASIWQSARSILCRSARQDSPGDISSSIILLCVVVAIFASAQFMYDLASQVTALDGRVSIVAYAIQGLVKAVVACVTAIVIVWPHAGKFTRSMIIVVVVLALMAEENVYYISRSLGASYPALFQIATTTSLSFLCWLIPLTVLLSILRSTDDRNRRSATSMKVRWGKRRMVVRWGETSIVVLSAGLAAVGFVLAVEKAGIANVGYYLAPFGILRLMAGCVIVFGVIRIVATRSGPVRILLDAGNRRLLAVATGYAMLVALPQSYLGFRLGLVAIIASLVTYVVLNLSSRNSLAELASKELQKKQPEAMRDLQHPEKVLGLQGKLADQNTRLSELTKELKWLDGGPPTVELLNERRLLKRESDILRCWPEAHSADLRPTGRPTVVQRRLLGHADEAESRVPLPESAGPIDMAMALGPAGGPLENLGKAFKPALGLVLLPICYFTWHDVSSGGSIADILLNPLLPLLIAFFRELTFWLFPLLILAVAWSSLAGRRGPGRALQVWVCIAVPVGCYAAITQALAQSGPLYALLRCAILLVCLLILGLWLDLSTLRRSKTVPLFSLFHGYVRLNGLAATLTLIIPLATAGLGIWSQIESGALAERVSPIQIQTQIVSVPKPTVSAHQSHAHKVHPPHRPVNR